MALLPRVYKTAVVAVAHRLCRVLYALLRDGTEFQPTRLGIEEGPFTKQSRAGFVLRRNRRDGCRSSKHALAIPSARPRWRL